MLWMVVLQWKSKKKDLSEVRGRADEGRKREEGKEGGCTGSSQSL